MFDNGEDVTIAAKNRSAAFYVAKRFLCKQYRNDKEKLDSMSLQGWKNVRVERLT
jgi:hypothetical protein